MTIVQWIVFGYHLNIEYSFNWISFLHNNSTVDGSKTVVSLQSSEIDNLWMSPFVSVIIFSEFIDSFQSSLLYWMVHRFIFGLANQIKRIFVARYARFKFIYCKFFVDTRVVLSNGSWCRNLHARKYSTKNVERLTFGAPDSCHDFSSEHPEHIFPLWRQALNRLKSRRYFSHSFSVSVFFLLSRE